MLGVVVADGVRGVVDRHEEPERAGPSFDRVSPDYSFQKVAAAVRQAITRGELKAGDRLPPQRELQDVFGVSKVTILEALRVLEADGLVQVQVGRTGGAVILEPGRHSLARAIGLLLAMDQITLAEVAEVRVSVELQIARLVAQRLTPEHLVLLESLLGRLEALAAVPAEPADGTLYSALDLEFHTALADACGNRLLSACMQVLYHHVMRRAVAVSATTQAELNRSLRTLVEDGLKRRQPDAAVDAMRTHLAESFRVLGIAPDLSVATDLTPVNPVAGLDVVAPAKLRRWSIAAGTGA